MEMSDLCRWSATCDPIAGRTTLARSGEALAADHLSGVHGLEVLATNQRVAVEDLRGELDVVLHDRRGLLVVCEVKTRTAAPGRVALDALGPAQRTRIRRLTAVLIAQGTLRAQRVRFDLVTVDVRRGSTDRVALLEHRAGAW
jgi:putative endonuclease